MQRPSRCSIAPIWPVRVQASASRTTPSLYSALKHWRRGRSASSGSGTPFDNAPSAASPRSSMKHSKWPHTRPEQQSTPGVNRTGGRPLAVEPFYQGLIARQDQQRPVPLSAPSRRAALQNVTAMGIRWTVVCPTSGRAAVFYLLSLGFRPVSGGQGCALMHLGRLPTASLVALRRLNT